MVSRGQRNAVRSAVLMVLLLPGAGAIRAEGTPGVRHEVDGRHLSATLAHSPVPVIVDFWAPWCGPCRQMSATLAKLEHDLDGQVKVLSVNIAEYPSSGWSHGVDKIPTLLVYAKGKQRDRIEGNKSAAEILDHLSPHLDNAGGGR